MSRMAVAALGTTAMVAVGTFISSSAADGRKLSSKSWQRSYVNPKRPKVIKLEYHTQSAYELDYASVYFHPDRVAIKIWVHGPDHGQVAADLVVRCVSVRMGEPLRGRRRIDGTTHRHPRRRDVHVYDRELKLKRARCPRAKVVRHHFE